MGFGGVSVSRPWTYEQYLFHLFLPFHDAIIGGLICNFSS